MPLPRSYVKYPEPEGTVFYESWCTDLEKSAIEYAIEQTIDLVGSSVEVGSFEGRSAVFTANLLDPQTLICVDPWSPIPEATYEVQMYGEREIFGIFEENIEAGTNGNVRYYKTTWEDYFADLQHPDAPDKEIKYLYLDGPHTYDNVLESLKVITPHIVSGGVMIGDDYDEPSVKKAVVDFFGKDMTHPLSGRTWYWRNDG